MVFAIPYVLYHSKGVCQKTGADNFRTIQVGRMKATKRHKKLITDEVENIKKSGFLTWISLAFSWGNVIVFKALGWVTKKLLTLLLQVNQVLHSLVSCAWHQPVRLPSKFDFLNLWMLVEGVHVVMCHSNIWFSRRKRAAADRLPLPNRMEPEAPFD